MDYLRQILYAALSAGAVFYLFVRFSLRYWKRRGILHEPPKFLYGNLKYVFRKRHVAAVLEQLYNKYKGKAPFIGVYAYLKPMVLILDTQLVQRILVRDAELFAERHLYNDAQFDPMSVNLMQLDSKDWHRLRRKVQFCYSANRLPELLPALKRVANQYIVSLQNKRLQHEKLDITDLIDYWNVDVLSYMLFGQKLDSLAEPLSTFRESAHNCWRKINLFQAYLALNYPKLSPFLMFKSFDVGSYQYFKMLLKDQLCQRILTNKKQSDLLELFINTKHEKDPSLQLTHEQILVEVFSFMAFGLDACNSTLTFCLYELAFSQTIQDQARDEIVQVLQKHQNEITYEALNEMIFLKQILYETLRLYTPYPLVLRQALSDYEIPKTVFMLRKGQPLIVPIAAIHRDERIYPEPLEFQPQRFEKTGTEASAHSMNFFPFGAWPRECPARHFVELQMLVCLVNLLRQYKFSACEQTCRPPTYDPTKLVLKPKEPIILLVEHLKAD